MKHYPTQETLNELFNYRDGHLYWKNTSGPRTQLIVPAGWNCRRYRDVKIQNKTYKLHRLVWIFHYGTIPESMVIDHIDGDGFNNSIENLRIATNSLNQCNQVNRKHVSKSQTRGVYTHGNKFVAKLTKNGVSTYLGCFSTAVQASTAYQHAFTNYQKELNAKVEAQAAEIEFLRA